jgi:hypothetical protein
MDMLNVKTRRAITKHIRIVSYTASAEKYANG